MLGIARRGVNAILEGDGTTRRNAYWQRLRSAYGQEQEMANDEIATTSAINMLTIGS
jgi:hypothetical protein